MSKAKSILDQIRKRYHDAQLKEQLLGLEPNYNEFDIDTPPLTADDWQEFKRKFVEEINGEPVQSSGLTHSELLNYIKTSGEREGDEFNNSRKLRAILKAMDDDDEKN